MFQKNIRPAEKLPDLGLLPGKDKGGMTCYIGPCALLNRVDDLRVKTMSVKFTLKEVLEGVGQTPPVCLFGHADREMVDMLRKRSFPVQVNEDAKFLPKKGDWIFVACLARGSENEGRLVPASLSVKCLLVVGEGNYR